MKNIALVINTSNGKMSETSFHLYTELNKIGNVSIFEAPKPENANAIANQNKIDEAILNSLKESNMIVFENSGLNLELASELSSIFDCEIYTNVIGISGDLITCQIFSGKAQSNYKVTNDKTIFVASKTFKSKDVVEINDLNLNNKLQVVSVGEKAKVIQIDQNQSGISLVDAKFVVGAGRGMKDPSNWGIIEDLAKKIGAGLACSKPVSDINWRPHHEHVGQTGIKIAPKLYIACGISGAIQHLAGVNGSDTIIVINSDPEAPFVKNADYAIIGDLFQVVPELLNNIN